MKVDTYLLGRWPSEQQSLHLARRSRPSNTTSRTKHQAELVRQNPGWRAAGTSGPPGSQRWLSVAVFSIECSGLAQRYA
jgi:hypothetical protein